MLADTVTWTRVLATETPRVRETYRITYVDKDGATSIREIELVKLGHSRDELYLGVNHAGKFKTLRADRIIAVEQLSQGHAPGLFAYPTYNTTLPQFPVANAVYRIATTAAGARIPRTWAVDLNHYTCTCPEKRIRSGFGYAPGQLGFVCDHIAKAILRNLPAGAEGWSDQLRAFLADPRKVHVDNLVQATHR